ncbi:MAG: hypothetical protein LWX51_01045 [Deltaproteobacteria bacterium]|jgi:DMSO reductase anchor subunit|nr:hypothetical protein [Deltaproteobacteria bacterium]
MQLVQTGKQKVWGWPAVANFTLGGAATGFYLLGSVIVSLQDSALAGSPPFAFKLLAPLLIALGFLALTIEAGRPLRGHHLFRHISGSWISLECLAGAIFVPAAVIDWLFPHPVVWILAAVAAMALMISQGFIVYRARAVSAWNVPLMPLLFVTSGFSKGSGLVLLSVVLDDSAVGHPCAMIGLICVLLNLSVWFLYLSWSREATFREAIEALRRPNALIFTVGLGHLLPGILLLVILVAPGIGIDTGTGLWHTVVALAGVTMVAGGMSQKAGIILGAGYLRGIVLERSKGDARAANPAFPKVLC